MMERAKAAPAPAEEPRVLHLHQAGE